MLTNFIFITKQRTAREENYKKEDQMLTLPGDRVNINSSLNALTYDE